MKRETKIAAQDCNGCYYTNSLLAIKINIVLEININNSSLADREEGTSATSTGKTGRKWIANEETGGV